MGQNIGSKVPDPDITTINARQMMRDQISEQVKRTVNYSILRKKRQDMASVAHAVAAIIVLAEVSVREDLDRLNVDMRAILEAVTMIPLLYVPTGEVGLPVGAILS